jgi:hypothetical protein
VGPGDVVHFIQLFWHGLRGYKYLLLGSGQSGIEHRAESNLPKFIRLPFELRGAINLRERVCFYWDHWDQGTLSILFSYFGTDYVVTNIYFWAQVNRV